MKIIEESAMSDSLDQGIKAGLCRCFPADQKVFSKTRGWHGSMPAWSVIYEDAGTIVAHVGIVDRIIKAGNHPLRVAGIQNVFILPEYRGQGLADTILKVSMKAAGEKGFDAGLLYCLPVLGKIYTRCGWKLLPEENIIRIDETGVEQTLPDKNMAMFFPLKVSEFPAGTIHLQGNDW